MSELRLPDGDDPAFDPHAQPAVDPLEAVGHFAEGGRTKYIDLARRRLRHHGVEEATLAPEGAVQEACLRICRRIKSGKVPPVTTWEDWDIRLTRMLKKVAREKCRWQRAGKRTPPGRDHDEQALLDAPDRHARRPDDEVLDRQRFEWLLALLDDKGRKLRSIAIMKRDGYTNEEIARELGVRVKTIEWKLRRIRSIWGPHLNGQE